MLQLQRYTGPEPRLTAAGLPEGLDALIFTRAARKHSGISLFVARDDSRAASFIAGCRFFAPDIPVISLPAWDCLPYDRISPSRLMSARRSAALYLMSQYDEAKPLIIVSTVSGVSQKVPPKNIIREAGFKAHAGNILAREKLEYYLAANGYSRASTVIEPGDFAIRGGLIDIFSPAFDEPVRLDFFGDELETIRHFDVETQRTTRQNSNIDLAPVSELYFDETAISNFRTGYVAKFGGGISKDPIYAAVSEGIRSQGIEHFLPLFFDGLETVFDYLAPGTMIAFDSLFNEALAERYELILDFYESRQAYVESKDTGAGDPAKTSGVYRPLPVEDLYITPDHFDATIHNHRSRLHSPFIPPDADELVNFGGKTSRNFSNERKSEGINLFDAVTDYVKTELTAERTLVVASWTEGSSERLASVFDEHGLNLPEIKRGPDLFDLPASSVRRAILPIEHGFEFGKLTVLSEQDILGDRLVNRGRKRKAKNFISEASALQPGDLIIHIDHGLGRYLGLKTLSVQNAPHDCLDLEYADNAKLYLPVENIELLSRYGAGGETAVLDKLGGVAWQSRKAKAKNRLRNMAAELIKIAAKRALRTAEPMDIPAGEYNEFCARFPYVETEDQLSAIEDVFEDLTAGRPMDRLICGDVGFGKTEVALRAAFAAVMNGQQVAMVAPTTILARQHFKTFSERFRGLPVTIRQLSRLVSPKQATETKEELRNGRCDIVVGTHALLAKTVGFSNLGLLVVDEEQRFGVQHKERLKSLRANVHVLTLTATPIPRTLQMALSGIRDLSLIATPPVDRLAVRTYVSPFDKVSIRKAILREKYRGGQSFFVAPRIADLPRLEDFLQEDVPEVKYVIAHGQMPGRVLEDIMTAYYDGQYDVLLSTSIIESGIDIPSANTMIIYRSDRFGLAQLYQMRGRVGRSKVRAYAYLTMPDEHVATPGALQRLKILQSLDTLGAGFTLASHDLDMRGGGNPLGEEQSGYIKDVGVELYQHMLEEAVAELRDDIEVFDQSWSPNVNMGVAVLIPETYVSDLNLRLATYRRIADIEDDQASEAFAVEMIDRFGPLPSELEALLKVMKIKRLCRKAHVEKVDAGPRGIVIHMRHEDVKDPSKILFAITQNKGWKLRPDQTIFIPGQLEKPAKRIKAAERALTQLVFDEN
ncbi:MAG: transcription-repair coupling factor [Hellea sp.]|nr:transcription-repair coupling factor [Hellea sp.]